MQRIVRAKNHELLGPNDGVAGFQQARASGEVPSPAIRRPLDHDGRGRDLLHVPRRHRFHGLRRERRLGNHRQHAAITVSKDDLLSQPLRVFSTEYSTYLYLHFYIPHILVYHENDAEINFTDDILSSV